MTRSPERQLPTVSPAVERELSRPIELGRDALTGRTLLLGNGGGFVLYLPVTQNVPDRSLHTTKWFGASGFGRAYLEDNLVWLVRHGIRTKLDRRCQTGFAQEVDRAVLTFAVDGCSVRQTFFVPNRVDAFFMTLEADGEAEFAIQPELDMRYYQTFNDSFDGYHAEILEHRDRRVVRVTNEIAAPTPTLPHMSFYAFIGASRDDVDIRLLPESRRLRDKVYLKDEARKRLVERVYEETQERSPDHAPIWDLYRTKAYAPAELHGSSPLTLLYGFGDHPDEARDAYDAVAGDLTDLERRTRRATLDRLQLGRLRTEHDDIDRAYAHVLARFNDGLVARNVKFHGDFGQHDHFNAIFAGNKYFLDAWKRDENISLIGLLTTGDYETVRAILSDTWSYQDPRTGRLPHIIRLGQPLVYYSSDGTLWALERLDRYTRVSGDRTLLDEKYPMVEHFFDASLDFVQRGLLPSGGIIDPAYLWETWMDTPYTPRDGYPVEIELLWLTALTRYLPVIRSRNEALAGRLEETLTQGQESMKRFIMDGYLADSLSYEWEPRDLLTPNGYIAFGLDFPLPDDLARNMVTLGREQLAGRVGIRGLAPRDWPKVFPSKFLRDPENVRGHDMTSVGIYNYHRGIEWLWLNQFFVAGELMYGDADAAFSTYLQGQVDAAMHESGVGGLGELYDGHGPLGADFQAWSMAGFVGSLHQFGGVDVSANERCVRIWPSLPSHWESFAAGYRVGNTRFGVRLNKSEESSEITIHPVDSFPEGYELELGIPLEAEVAPPRIQISGVPVSQQHIEPVRSRQIARFQIRRTDSITVTLDARPR